MPVSSRWSVAALGAGLALSLGAVPPVAVAVAPGSPAPAAAPAPSARSTASAAAPSDWRTRSAAVRDRVGVELPVREAVAQAIEPGDHVCVPTGFAAYVDGLVGGLELEELMFLVFSGALEFATYDALLHGTEADRRYDLTQDRQQLERTFRDAQRFWDAESADIQLVAMNGDILRDRARLTRLLVVLYGLSPQDAAAYADEVVRTVAEIPELRGGDNPIFSLNAFAFTAEGYTDPLISSIPDKIVVGDGILDALHSMGIGEVGPEAVLAHEFAHHVQFEKGLFDSPLTGPEATRRTELMADAMGTYQVTHKRGLARNARRVLQAERTFYQVGDCQFDNPAHHGTPNQRLRAATWGASVARSQRKRGRVLPALSVARRFDAVLPRIVAPDAG